MKIIAAIQILIKLFTIGYGTGAVRTTERFTAPAAAGKRADTCGFYPLNSRFPLFPNPAQTRDRRPLRKEKRQRIFSSVGARSVRPFSLPLRSSRLPCCYNTVYSPQARRNSVAVIDGTCEYFLVPAFHLTSLHSNPQLCTNEKGEPTRVLLFHYAISLSRPCFS